MLDYFGYTKLITVNNMSTAHILLGKLTSFEIDATIRSDSVGGMEDHFNFTRGVHIFVSPKDISIAKQLIAETYPDE